MTRRFPLALPFLPFVVLALSHRSADAGADRAALPVVPRAKDAPIVALRAQGPSQILIRGGTFIMGSTREDNDEAVDLCKRDWPADLCEKAFVNEFDAHEVSL